MEKRYSYSIFIIFQFLFIIQLNAQDGITLNAKIFLSGCYSEGEMRTDLLSHNLIPTSHPYNDPPLNYLGTESVTNLPADIVDWILIELRSDLNTKISQKASFLRKDGQIVGLDGNSNPIFSSMEQGEYYIVIYHRNHLAIMSSSKILLNNNSSLYDFTDSPLKAFGNNSLKDFGDGNFGIIAGDGDQNGIVNNLDYGAVANNIFNSVYISGDLDLNGLVNVLDYSQIYNNLLKNSNVPFEESDILTVSTFTELKSAIASADSGDVILVTSDIEFLDDSATYYGSPWYNRVGLLINQDVTIQGVTYATRPRLWNDGAYTSYAIFGTDEAEVTFKNLHIDGSEASGGGRRGIQNGKQINLLTTFDSTSTILVDSCEIKGWFGAGVAFSGITGTIRNSYIHNNRGTGYGYGVRVDNSCDVAIYNNTFDSNRHSVAGGGDPTSNYDVYNNDIYFGTMGGGVIDMHGWREAGVTGSPWAGGELKIHDNTFHAPATDAAFMIRGKPFVGAEIYGNILEGHQWLNDEASNNNPRAISLSALSDTAYGNIKVWNNSFNTTTAWLEPRPMTFQVQYDSGWVDRIPVYPYDIPTEYNTANLFDAGADVFTSGTYSWNAYGSNTIANVGNELQIVNVDNDGGAYVYLRDEDDLSADLVVDSLYELTVDAYVNTGWVRISAASTAEYTYFDTVDTAVKTTYTTTFNHTGTGGLPLINCLKFEDGADTLYLDNLSLRQINTTDHIPLAYGDFNGDGITDVITNYRRGSNAIEENGGQSAWYGDSNKIFIAWSALGYWRNLNDSNYAIAALSIADVDGDGKSDLIYNETTYSSGGFGAWTTLPNAFNTYTLYTTRDFNGDGVDDPYRISSE